MRQASGAGASDFIRAIIIGGLLLSSKLLVEFDIIAPLWRWAAVLGPPAVIIGYWVHGNVTGKGQHADLRQRFADNVYFLGFIFTMLSLIAAFLPVAFKPDTVVTPQSVYYAFGTALIATALGLIGRVVIMQSAVTSEELAVRVEEDLTRLAVEVAEEAEQIVTALAGAREAVSRQSETVVEAVLGATAPRMDAIASSFQLNADQLSERLQQHASETEAATMKLRERLATRSDDLVQAAEMLGGARNQLGDALDSLRLPVARLNEDLRAVSAASQAAVEGLRTDVAALAQSLSLVGHSNQRLIDGVERLEAGTDSIGGRIDDAAGRLLSGADAGATRVDDGIARIEAQLADAEARAAALQADADGFRRQMADAIATFEAAVDRFTAQLAGLGQMPAQGGSDGTP